MQVSYGPPGHRGVTHLMAVGAEDAADEHPLDSALVLGAIATGAAVWLGAPRALVRLGALGILGLGLANLARKRARTVEITVPVGRY
jgi:hypothetical protein